MALRYFGIEKGAYSATVTEGAATTNKDIEVVVDLAAGATRLEVEEAVWRIMEYITNQSKWPPA